MSVAKIRLCVDHALGAGQSVPVTEAQAHYLFGVMRLAAGAPVLMFNGRDGEWLAEVAEAGKRKGVLVCRTQTRPQGVALDLWLLFAPVKKARTDMIVEKAVELGVARIQPVITDFTNSERMRRDKALAHIREAAEQCGATYLPEYADPVPLARVLDDWDATRRILWADEAAPRSSSLAALFADPGKNVQKDGRAPAWAVLIGPEGGFSENERTRLRAADYVTPVSLGPRILRAETAAIATLALWQVALGDWQ
jgi:16S rRNA (uracil1498-N3)-methyltransferase